VGLGRIGMGYDLGAADHYVLSHARGFSRHVGFALAGGVDPSAARRREFTEAFAQTAFATIEDAVAHTRPDVVVISTPTESHLPTVLTLLAARAPRVILCEKPMTSSVPDAMKLLDLCSAAGSTVMVNYMRRSSTTTADIQARLASGAIGTPLRGTVWYSKGLFNSASHFVNLTECLLGPATHVVRLPSSPPFPGDPDFRVYFGDSVVDFRATGLASYFHNSMEWITPTGRLRYERSGAAVSWEGLEADTRYAGYTVLREPPEYLVNDFNCLQGRVVEHLHAWLTGRASSLCDGRSALRTLEILRNVEEQR
jgi:predicted dehydrogenase